MPSIKVLYIFLLIYGETSTTALHCLLGAKELINEELFTVRLQCVQRQVTFKRHIYLTKATQHPFLCMDIILRKRSKSPINTTYMYNYACTCIIIKNTHLLVVALQEYKDKPRGTCVCMRDCTCVCWKSLSNTYVVLFKWCVLPVAGLTLNDGDCINLWVNWSLLPKCPLLLPTKLLHVPHRTP